MTNNEDTDYFLNRRVIIANYNADWSHMFVSEKKKILSMIGNKNVIVEHIGSTAIPGLAAKPIIDIMVGVKDLATADACIAPLEKIDYEYVPKLEKDFPRRRYLHKGPNLPNKHFHLHMVEINSDFWNRQLFFRDYLRTNQKTSTKYQQLKENLAKQFQDDVFNYCEAKSDFIHEILSKRTSCEKTVEYNNIQLWVESFGEFGNKPILLIAGAHAPATFWPDFFCERLAANGHFVLRYDHRDIGYSTHFPATDDINKPKYSLKDLAEDALAILDKYKIKKAYTIGHSMGGGIVQYLAAFHANHLLGAISISVNIAFSIKHPNYEATMQKLLENKPTGDFEKDWPGWLNSWRLLHGDTYECDEAMAKLYTKDIYTRHEGGDLDPAWNHIAAGLTKPVLIEKLPQSLVLIHGSEDIMQPVDEIKTLKNRFKVYIINGAGHVFFNAILWNKILEIVLRNT